MRAHFLRVTSTLCPPPCGDVVRGASGRHFESCGGGGAAAAGWPKVGHLGEVSYERRRGKSCGEREKRLPAILFRHL